MSIPVRKCIWKLKKHLGEKLVDDPAIVSLYVKEPSGLEGDAYAVALPESEDDLRFIVSTCVKHRVPMYGQGSMTSLSGNAVPRGGIVISFEMMNRIHKISVVDRIAIVEPGIRLEELNEKLAEYGLMFPVDPASSGVATVGGAIANGAGGLRGAKYGTMRDWVLGLRIVLPNEEASTLNVGCSTVKCRQGYDLTRLIIGSEGTLALVTRAILRLAPLPEDTVYALAFYDSLEDLVNAFVEVRKSGLNPFMLEFMDAATVEYASRSLKVPYRAEGHLFLVGVETFKEASSRILSKLVDILRRYKPKELVTAIGDNDMREKKLLAVRKNLFAGQAGITIERLGKGKQAMVMIEDIVVPPSRVPEAVEEIRRLGEKYGLLVFLGGHIGDGNLHPAVGFDSNNIEEKKKVEEWFQKVMEVAIKLGGSVSAEHGIGLLKIRGLKRELERRGAAKALELMRGIKKLFDPYGLLNPGKVLPTEEERK